VVCDDLECNNLSLEVTVHEVFGNTQPMTNLTTTWQQARLAVRPAVLTNLLTFALIYTAIWALLELQGSYGPLLFVFDRYGVYLDYLGRHFPMPTGILIGLLCLIRFLILSLWLHGGTKLARHPIRYSRLLRGVMVAEMVFLLPAWLHMIWAGLFQGNLNELPSNSFEPLMLPQAWGSLLGSSLDSYGLMHLALVTLFVTRPVKDRKKQLIISIGVGMLSGTLLWQFALALLPGVH